MTFAVFLSFWYLNAIFIRGTLLLCTKATNFVLGNRTLSEPLIWVDLHHTAADIKCIEWNDSNIILLAVFPLFKFLWLSHSAP